MADIANVNRKAVAKALVHAIDGLTKLAGISIQTHRAYESMSKGGAGYTQKKLAVAAGTDVPTISKLENGHVIPNDTTLKAILRAAGFDMTSGHGGAALYDLLRALRDTKAGMKRIETELPK